MGQRHSCEECTVRGAHGFCGLRPDALRYLDRLGTQVSYAEGETVLAEDSAADRVCVICKGTIKLTMSSRDGRLLLLRIAGPGDILGLAATLKGTHYEATAEALEECDMRVISRRDFMRFMEEFQQVGVNSATAVAEEYRCAVLSARRLALSGSAAGKLASVLLEWGRMSAGPAGATRGHGLDTALWFRMPLTHEELGSMAGISRETATRVLTKLKGEGLIEMQGERMVLRFPAKLERLYC